MEAAAANKDKDMMLCQKLRQIADDTHQVVNRIKQEYYDSTVQDSPKVHTLSSDLESISLSQSSQQAQSPKPKNYEIIRNNYKKARSVLCLYNDDEMTMVNDPKPVRFSLLRVLDLTSPLYTKGVYVPFTDLSDLVLLKYLAWFVGSEGLEIILSKNQKLQTLLVSHSAAEWEEDSSLLPSTIWGSPQLRHLEFKNSLRVEPPSMVKEKLQTLYWLSISHCTEEVFSMIPNINTLGILCKRGSISHSHTSGTYSLKFLQCLDQLEDLTIESDYPISEHLPPRCIDTFPRNLRKLKLSGTHLPLGDIEAIALLPSLEVLKLKTDSLLGPEWKPTDGGFPSLKFLLLQHTKLQRWNDFDDEFPMLERLVLKECVRLEQIPITFSNINSLQSIELERCRPALLRSANKIKEEQLNYGNDALLVIDRTPQYTAMHYTVQRSVIFSKEHISRRGSFYDDDDDSSKKVETPILRARRKWYSC
nr:putative late blight resistance protein homolog R1A-4 [Ipomoea batatas]